MKISELRYEHQIFAYRMLAQKTNDKEYRLVKWMMEWDRVRKSLCPDAKDTEINLNDLLEFMYEKKRRERSV